jgi:flagellar assembly protein FliH
MTSSKDELVTEQADVISQEELAAYQRWQAPTMVSVTDVEEQPLLTVEDIEKLHTEAEEEGYKVGFDKGQAEGYQAGMETAQQEIKQEIEQKVALLEQVMSCLNTPLENLDQDIERDLISLVMTMTKQLVLRELNTSPENVIDVVKTAMATLPISDRQVKLFLHPLDVELVKSGLSIDGDDTPWKCVEDPLLTRGGARVETADTRVDATVESRLNSVINKMLGEGSLDDSAE